MAAAYWIVAFSLVGVLAGCTDHDETIDGGGAATTPTESASVPVERWAANAEARAGRFVRAAAKIDPALDEPGLEQIGPPICRGMFALRTDDELIELAQQEVKREVGVDLTAVQAAELLVVTNDVICPDLLR